ncbi:alginate lyase family protein [Enterococcus faecium]|uniref:alginate lyase family protein n=1 Tax=Enterococcus faecium TaxID=1352 RepID=UPI001F5B7EC2|nr:alginate lyase family protein [Enterococcus faecium]UNQ14892.1 alginate lyase family protein [Enterococcus faecium]HDL6579969.1 alginate lyase family protein [Enterococcus faecium]
MADMMWLLQRLKAMSVPEVCWRLTQKVIQKNEERCFGATKLAVTETLFNSKLSALSADVDRFKLEFNNTDYSLSDSIHLLGGYSYEEYKKKWNAGFQTNNCWPNKFSYALEYKQRDDIGDARTNWELNRHFQFALLAKNYYASKDEKYLKEFRELFLDWNEKNPFLHGISWTSVMEVAIRLSNWSYALVFLKKSPNTPKEILRQLEIGIINMTDYVAHHYSRYSSANNHLIVEAFSIGQSGILFNYTPWIELATSILTREFPLQNYEDGVNKELSLHYQSFYMEAVGLMMRLMVKNNIMVPEEWYSWLSKMSRYMSDCIGKYGEIVEFGDNDEGKILDLEGSHFNHYKYVLGMMSCLLENTYIPTDKFCENLHWLFSKTELDNACQKPIQRKKSISCYRTGGNTILRSHDESVLIGIDHAELGFGSIAAHGHADALSFQMYVKGKSLFVDPGTYIYHCDLRSRDEFRKTINHNTVCVDGKDQSEMKGAFLWGKRASSRIVKLLEDNERVIVGVSHDGYAPLCVERTYEYNCSNQLIIKDCLDKNETSNGSIFSIQFVLGNDFLISNVNGNIIEILDSEQCVHIRMEICSSTSLEIRIIDKELSKNYGEKRSTQCVLIKGNLDKAVNVVTTIICEEN